MRYVCVFILVFACLVLPVLADDVEKLPEIEVVESEGGSGEIDVPSEDDVADPAVPSAGEGVEDESDAEKSPVVPVAPEGEEDSELLPGDDAGDIPPVPSEGDESFLDNSAMVDSLRDELSGLADGVYNVWSTLAQTEEFAPRAVPDEAPVAGYYMEVSSNLGKGELYVPAEYRRGSFAFDVGGNLMSLSNSSINAILVVGSSVYDVRFSLFSRPQYRRSSGSSWVWADLGVHSVTGGNVQVFARSSDVLPWVSDDVSSAIIVLFLGAIVCKLFMSK